MGTRGMMFSSVVFLLLACACAALGAAAFGRRQGLQSPLYDVAATSSLVVCASVQENPAGRFSLACPGHGMSITEVTFASWGGAYMLVSQKRNPSCHDYNLHPLCHAPTSVSIVKKYCLGRTSCDIDMAAPALARMFPQDPCPGSVKGLAVVVRCTKAAPAPPSRCEKSYASHTGTGHSGDALAMQTRCMADRQWEPAAFAPGARLELFVVHVEAADQEAKKAAVLAQIASSRLLSGLEIHWVGVDARKHDIAGEYMNGTLASAAMRHIVWPAVVGGHHMTRGALGCALSHAEVWERCVRANVDGLVTACVVLEDDVVLEPGFDWMFRYDLDHLPPKWAAWYLATVVADQTDVVAASRQLPSSLYEMDGETWGTYGYVVRPEAADTLSHSVWPLEHQIDSQMMRVYKAKNMQILRSATNLVGTDNKWGRASLTQVYALEKSLVPAVVHFVRAGARAVLGREEEERLRKLARSWGGSKLQVWGTDALPLPVAVEGIVPVLSDAVGSSEHRAAMCLVILEFAGGTCVTDGDVAALRERGNILDDVQAFFAYEWDMTVSAKVFGAVAGHPLIHAIVHQIMQGQSVRDAFGAIPRRITRGITLFPPNLFTPLPLDHFGADVVRTSGRTFDTDAILSFRNSRVYARLRRGIPRKLHFVQLGRGISQQASRCVRSWLKNHPQWTVRIWGDDDIASLGVEPLVRECNSMAQRSDVMRLEILHTHGGLYVDTDIESFKSVDSIVSNASGLLIHEENVSRTDTSRITNALFGSVANHPILRRAMTLLQRVPVLNTRWVNLETGPAFLGRKVVGTDVGKFRVLPFEYFHPITYTGRKALLQHNCYKESCREHFPSAYGIHLLAQEDTWWNHTVQTSARAFDDVGVARLAQLLRDVDKHNARLSGTTL